MAPTLDVGRSVLPISVADRHIDDLQMLFVGTKEQVEITEWIKVAKKTAVPLDLFVVAAMQHLGTTKGVLYRLTEQPAKRVTEKLVRHHVAELHRFTFHWVN